MEHGEETMTIVDENGVEHVCEVIFTFESKDYGKSYVLYHILGEDDEQDEDEEIEIHASSFTPAVEGEDGEEGGELLPIEDEEEWAMIQETFATFVDEEEEDEDEE